MATRLLYRALRRRLALVDPHYVKAIDIPEEKLKMEADPERYTKYLRAELGYLIRQAFERPLNDRHHPRWVAQFERGARLVDQFADANYVVQQVLDQRHEDWLHQQWHYDNIKHEEAQPKDTHRPSLHEKRQQNTDHLLRRWFKHEQQNGGLPIPQKLSYVERIADTTLNPFGAIPESTKANLINQAYDSDYVEGIIKPSLAYDINRNHYLRHLDDIVNHRGPFKPRILTTSAGPNAAPYIRMPYRQDESMGKLAVTIKRWLTATRINAIWQLKQPLTNENQQKNGGYAIRTRGNHDDVIYPRAYYEQWASDEAQWEALIEGRDFDTVLKEWIGPLDTTLKHLQDRVQHFKSEIGDVKAYEPLRQQLEEGLNQHYDDLANVYERISQQLRSNPHTFKHGEIVNSDRNPDGSGKQLGDYLKSYKHFQWGDEFYDRFTRPSTTRDHVTPTEQGAQPASPPNL